MFSAVLTAGLAVVAASFGSHAYESQLQSLVGQPYTEAVELLGTPVERNIWDSGGEIWVFRNQADGSPVPADLAEKPAALKYYVMQTGQDMSASIRPRRVPEVRICTTRIALESDGTVAGYAYQGTCRPR
jgi:hypothetical protein